MLYCANSLQNLNGIPSRKEHEAVAFFGELHYLRGEGLLRFANTVGVLSGATVLNCHKLSVSALQN